MMFIHEARNRFRSKPVSILNQGNRCFLVHHVPVPNPAGFRFGYMLHNTFFDCVRSFCNTSAMDMLAFPTAKLFSIILATVRLGTDFLATHLAIVIELATLLHFIMKFGMTIRANQLKAFWVKFHFPQRNTVFTLRPYVFFSRVKVMEVKRPTGFVVSTTLTGIAKLFAQTISFLADSNGHNDVPLCSTNQLYHGWRMNYIKTPPTMGLLS